MNDEEQCVWDEIYSMVVAITALFLFTLVVALFVWAAYNAWLVPEPARLEYSAPAHTPTKGKGL